MNVIVQQLEISIHIYYIYIYIYYAAISDRLL